MIFCLQSYVRFSENGIVDFYFGKLFRLYVKLNSL